MHEPDLVELKVPVALRDRTREILAINGFLVDARTLPMELQEQARQRGLIPDLDARRAA